MAATAESVSPSVSPSVSVSVSASPEEAAAASQAMTASGWVPRTDRRLGETAVRMAR